MAESAGFGVWLRQRRRDYGLTQEDLAQQVACSVELIRKIERDVRHPSARVALRLADVFAIPPAERTAFLRLARGDALRAEPTPIIGGQRPGNLPAPVVALFGRDDDARTVAGMLTGSETRLLTLTGMGGVGKTQLALSAARLAESHYPDGVWLVELASVREAGHVGTAIIRALGLPESGMQPLRERLVELLRNRRLLLLLDNFEHLLPASDILSDLLRACAHLSLLVTSRVRLKLYGETVIQVAPLPTPDADWVVGDPSGHMIASVALFVARARAADIGFELTASNSQAVAVICRQLAGLPLAIELAAAHMRYVSPTTLVQHLKPALPVLDDGPRDQPERLQSMRAAIAWSYQLLPVELQLLFRQQAVFVGGWTIDAATAICLADTTPAVAAAALVSLTDQHLVQVDISGPAPRFSMLEVIREFALEQLQQDGGAPAVFERHAMYYAALAREANHWLWRAEQLIWLQRLDAEQPNLRAALAWDLQQAGNRSRGIGMAADLAWFWWLHNQAQEGIDWLECALVHRGSVPQGEQARVLLQLGILAVSTSDYQRGAVWCHEARACASACGDTRSWVFASANLAAHLLYQGAVLESRDLLVQALEMADSVNDSWLVVAAYWNLGCADLRAAQQFRPVDEMLELARQLGERWNISGICIVQGWNYYVACEYSQAIQALTAAETAAREIGDRRMQAVALRSLGHCRTAQGAYAAALVDFDHAIEHLRAVGDRFLQLVVNYERGQTQRRKGDLAAARAVFHDLLNQFLDLDRAGGAVLPLVGLAHLHTLPDHAAMLLGALTPTDGSRSFLPGFFSQRDYEEALAHTRAQLSPQAFEAAWQAGRGLSLKAMIVLAGRE